MRELFRKIPSFVYLAADEWLLRVRISWKINQVAYQLVQRNQSSHAHCWCDEWHRKI